jgi:aspartyl-tRNA(Asn)/glutamyl-tRNA(Gln) amidotransferase subunit B
MSDNKTLIKGRTGDWEIVMGLEIHAQVASKAKLFSGAAVGFGAGPNEQVSLVDAGFPGMLPTLNKHCVEQAVKSGLGLKAQINLKSQFDRKNYFYPDLPTGYQISQLYHPNVGEGVVEVEAEDGSFFNVGIERLHLEQDAGKLIHDLSPTESFVDLNRAGTALMEIVSRPDIRTPEEAVAYVKKIRTILIYLGTCDGDMDKGNLRADVNVSVCRVGNYAKFKETGDFGFLGTRCEIKNVNSFRFISQAINYEARRQIEILEDGGSIIQETRLYDPTAGETRSMRSKEEAMDYRYFPDPDLLPLEIEQAWIDEIKANLPELPDEKRRRLMADYGLSQYDRRQGLQREPAAGGARGPTGRADRDRRHLVKDRQGGVRLRLERRGQPRRGGREARPEAGYGYGRHREGRGRHHRRQPGQGGGGGRETASARLVRRSGHEGHGRQGQPRRRQRHP